MRADGHRAVELLRRAGGRSSRGRCGRDQGDLRSLADQLRVADITFVALASGLAYLAVIMDAWSRRVVGYALDREIGARLVTAALKTAIASRRPLPGCVFHTDRGGRYGSKAHRRLLKDHGFVGSMSRRAIPPTTPLPRAWSRR